MVTVVVGRVRWQGEIGSWVGVCGMVRDLFGSLGAGGNMLLESVGVSDIPMALEIGPS